MATYIPVDLSKQKAAVIRQGVDALKRVRDIFTTNKSIMDAMGAGDTPAVFDQVESEYGLPAGQGQAFYNLVNALNTGLGTAAVSNVINRLG